jgi:ribonuclease D
VFKGDLDKRTHASLIKQPYLQVDTETDGLDFRVDKLRLVQLCTKDRRVYMVHHPSERSYYLASALTHHYPAKYFHHALFDLRFIKFWLGVDVRDTVHCTKTLMKIVHPELPSGLANSIKNILGIKLKQPRVDYTKWKEDKLTEKQKAYAADDVLYLYTLAQQLYKDARQREISVYHDAMDAIRRMTRNQVEGYEDLFDYPQDKQALEKRKAWLVRWAILPATMKELAGGRIC